MSYQSSCWRVQLAKYTQLQQYLVVNRQKLIHGPQVDEPRSKRIKPSGAASRRLKRQQGIILRNIPDPYVHVRKQKIQEGSWWERWLLAEKAGIINRQCETGPIAVCECLITPYIFYKHEIQSAFVSNSCKQLWGVERVAISWSASSGKQPSSATAWCCLQMNGNDFFSALPFEKKHLGK